MSKTILAIDDEKSMLAFYKVALAGFGEVKTAINLPEARAQLQGIDLIILDCHMEHDKEPLQERIAELKKVAPVLLCSGVQNPMVQAIGQAHGVAGYWNKGTDHDKLLTLVQTVLDKQG